MARYIDADLLHIKMEDLYEHHIEMRNFSADGAVADCLDMLDNTPTADVEEVKHGEWGNWQRTIKCSLCGFGLFPTMPYFKNEKRFTYEDENFRPNYCPGCGAKMDGGKVEPTEHKESSASMIDGHIDERGVE